MHIDARGEPCPRPVIRAKKALDSAEMDSITVAVDNAIAVENLEKMAYHLGHETQSHTLGDAHFEVIIKKNHHAPHINPTPAAQVPLMDFSHAARPGGSYLITSDCFGEGDNALGASLMKSFIFSLTELETPPQEIFFINGGVHLTTGDAATLPDLQILCHKGTNIYSCGACLDFYGLAAELKVGEVTNMFFITEAMAKAQKFIRI